MPPPTGDNIDAYNAAVQHAFAQVQRAVAASADLKAVPSNLTPALAEADAEIKTLCQRRLHARLFRSGEPECARGDTASATAVALVGDSNATMWAPALQQLATQRHWRLETLTMAGCPLMKLPTINPSLHRRYTECEQWRGQIIARLAAEHPRLVVVSMWRGYGPGNGYPSGFASYDSAWFDSLNRLVQQMRDTGAQALVLGPIPDPHSAVPICLSGHLDDATACSPPRSTAVNDVWHRG